MQDVTQCGIPFLVTQMVEYLEVFGKFVFSPFKLYFSAVTAEKSIFTIIMVS